MSFGMSSGMVMVAAFFIPLLGAFLIALAGRINDNLRETVTLVTAVTLALVVWSLLPEVLAGGRPSIHLFEIVPGIEIGFSLEPLGA